MPIVVTSVAVRHSTSYAREAEKNNQKMLGDTSKSIGDSDKTLDARRTSISASDSRKKLAAKKETEETENKKTESIFSRLVSRLDRWLFDRPL